jgi:PRC-barrel domain protein
MLLRHTLICAAVAAAGAVGYAAQTPAPTPQQPQPPQPVENRTTTQQVPQARRAKTVLGSKVSIQNNVAIGTVDDIIFNDDGYIEYLIVLNEGKLVTVPWEAAKFNFDKRQAVVNITETKYREIPTYTVTAYPNFYEPAYRTRIYTYYGITPRDPRILDRRRP